MFALTWIILFLILWSRSYAGDRIRINGYRTYLPSLDETIMQIRTWFCRKPHPCRRMRREFMKGGTFRTSWNWYLRISVSSIFIYPCLFTWADVWKHEAGGRIRTKSSVLLSKWVGKTRRISYGNGRKQDSCVDTNVPFILKFGERAMEGRLLLGTKLFINKANTFQFSPLETWQMWSKANMQCSFLNVKHQIKCKPLACNNRILTSDSDLQRLIPWPTSLCTAVNMLN